MFCQYTLLASFIITYIHVASHTYGQIILDEARFSDNTPASLAVLDFDEFGSKESYSLYGKGRTRKYDNEESLPRNVFPFDQRIRSPYYKHLGATGWVGLHGNLDTYLRHFPYVTIKKFSGNHYAAILPPPIKSVHVSLPKCDQTSLLQVSYTHYTNKEDPTPLFHLFSYDEIQATPCKLRIPLPYMEWLKDERHENIEMTGFIGIYDKNNKRLGGSFFTYPTKSGGIATVDFNRYINNEELSVSLQFANGDPAAFARVEIKEKGHNTFLKELEADRNGIIIFKPIDINSVKIYPSTNGLMGYWDNSVVRANIELFLPELIINHINHNKIVAVLPEDMKSIQIKYPSIRHDLNLEINTTPYDYDIEFGPYKRIIFNEAHLEGPLDIRVPLPYQSKSKFIKYYDIITFTGVVLNEGKKYIDSKQLEVPATPGVIVIADLQEQ